MHAHLSYVTGHCFDGCIRTQTSDVAYGRVGEGPCERRLLVQLLLNIKRGLGDVRTEQPDTEFHLSDPPPPFSQLSARELALPVSSQGDIHPS